jgi:hypothetical protein
MNSTLTLSHMQGLRAEFGPPVPPMEIRVFDFREQWRAPRTKKRRIRKKWAKQVRNWRSIHGRCYKFKTELGEMLVMGPDVKAKLDAND